MVLWSCAFSVMHLRIRGRAAASAADGPPKISMNIQQVPRAPAIRLRVRRRVFTDISGKNKSVSRKRGLYVFHKQTHMVQAGRASHVVCASWARRRNISSRSISASRSCVICVARKRQPKDVVALARVQRFILFTNPYHTGKCEDVRYRSNIYTLNLIVAIDMHVPSPMEVKLMVS